MSYQDRQKRLKALANYHIGDREDYILAVQMINRGFIESLGDGLLLRQYVRLPGKIIIIKCIGGEREQFLVLRSHAPAHAHTLGTIAFV